jgi:hypothetical protein
VGVLQKGRAGVWLAAFAAAAGPVLLPRGGVCSICKIHFATWHRISLAFPATFASTAAVTAAAVAAATAAVAVVAAAPLTNFDLTLFFPPPLLLVASPLLFCSDLLLHIYRWLPTAALPPLLALLLLPALLYFLAFLQLHLLHLAL